MLVPMVDIGEMLGLVGMRLVLMRMAVRFGAVPCCIVRMLVMGVVAVRMGM